VEVLDSSGTDPNPPDSALLRLYMELGFCEVGVSTRATRTRFGVITVSLRVDRSALYRGVKCFAA
jgi:hypothetical protein